MSATLSETTVALRDLRNDWKEARAPGGRLSRIPDIRNQIFPLDCPDRFASKWIPPYFWKYSLWLNPLQGFWEYQIKAFDHFFECWYEVVDGTLRMARQTGKSTTIPIPLSYLVIEEHVQLVVLSTKVEKARKITMPIRRAMWKDGRYLSMDSIVECRFDENEAGFKALSGREDAKKESETANVVIIDEAQDIPYTPTYKEVSPMRKGVGGIIFAMGIGGPDDSMMMTLVEQPDVHSMNVRYNEIPERPSYRAGAEQERTKMLAWEFASNYEGEPVSRKENTLLDKVHEWSDLFPAQPFSPALLDDIQIGIDWAEVRDHTCAVATGVYGETHVMFDFLWFARGEVVDYQIAEIVKFCMRVPFDKLRPESNHLGRLMIKMLWEKLEPELRKIGWKGQLEDIIQPVSVNDVNIDRAIRAIHELSAGNNLCYVRNEKNPHQKRFISSLKNVGVKRMPHGKLKNEHNDEFSALRTRYTGIRVARVAA